MKHIKKFIESNQDKLSKFYKEYEELCKDEDLGNGELWTEIGQLVLKYDLTKDDVLFILNNFNCKFDINRFLKETLLNWDNWDDNSSQDKLWDELLHKISGYSFPKDYDKVVGILKSKYDISRK